MLNAENILVVFRDLQNGHLGFVLADPNSSKDFEQFLHSYSKIGNSITPCNNL